MKKIIWGSVLTAIVSFVVWSKDPLNDTVNFIIAGTIPQTTISIGLWSTLLLAIFLLLLVRLGFKSTRFEMLEHSATQTKKEVAKQDFEKSHKVEFDRSKRSVIAAPRSESIF